ncbi:hypothetical protein [uncultured Roseobacter sp.]|uniref:hypothetical protein n=1 Tax=uncultured Roseobacter sp. TaxID=114847 RepID=UPI0026356502|nr:hypothetical protein [uncultured Roseobacter sp.]
MHDHTVSIAIVVGDPLVSQDIAGIFAFWQSGSISRIFDSITQARAVPPDDFDPMIVFVAARDGMLELDGQDFVWLERRRVITLDLQDTRRFPHWQHLARPFTQAQVIEAAHRLIEGDGPERVEAE